MSPLQRTALVCALVLLIAAGCGRESENLASVTGTITLDGEPLADALVVFAPTSGGTTAYGRTDESGRYEMMFSDVQKGAWLGENRVQISTGDVGAAGGPGKPERVPVTYNRQSGLLVEVVPGENDFDFQLESDAGPIAEISAD